MILTLNSIIDKFQTFSEDHGQINDFIFGTPQDSNDRDYPLLNVTLETPSYVVQGDRSLTPQMSLTFKLIDRIITFDNNDNGYRSTNQGDIYSDNFQIMIDLVQYIKNNLSNPYGIVLRSEDLVTIDPIQQINEDDVCGWEMDLQLTVKYLNCEIPNIT